MPGSAEQGQAAPAAGGAAQRSRRHRAVGRQGVGGLRDAIGPAVHYAGAGRRAAGDRGQYFRPRQWICACRTIRWRSSSTPSPIPNTAWPRARCGSSAPTASPPQDEARNPTSAVPVSTTAAEPFYRARIAIDRVALHDVPAGFHVIPGMPVTADIKVGKRTVLKYLLGFVLPVAQEGMREP